MAIRTHYENLQVLESATEEVIRGAYRYLAQKWHPDKNPENLASAERNTKIINEAYQVLSDPGRRREHDAWIAVQRAADRIKETPGAAETSASKSTADPTSPRGQRVFLDSLRWMIYIPLGCFIGAIASGLMILIGSKIVGDWALPSGVILYCAMCAFPLSILAAALSIAPRKNRAAKWALLAPLMIAGFLISVGILAQLAFMGEPVGAPYAEEFPRLSGKLQLGIVAMATCHGLLWVAMRSPRELANWNFG